MMCSWREAQIRVQVNGLDTRNSSSSALCLRRAGRGCRNVVVDAATGARRTLPGAGMNVVTWPWPAEPGVVSPDGALAAVTVASGPQGAALDVVNLSTGRTTTIPVPIGTSSDSRTLAWSADSRWLFVLTGDGRLVAVRASDGSVHSLGVPLPPLSPIAMRGVAS